MVIGDNYKGLDPHITYLLPYLYGPISIYLIITSVFLGAICNINNSGLYICNKNLTCIIITVSCEPQAISLCMALQPIIKDSINAVYIYI